MDLGSLDRVSMILGTIITLTLMIIYTLANLFVGTTTGEPACTRGMEQELSAPAIITGAGAHSAISTQQAAVLSKYRYLKPTTKMSFHEFCYPQTYSIQPQQKFAGEYMKPPGTKELLVYHRIGAGKTCLSIQIGLRWVRAGAATRSSSDARDRGPHVLYVMPASLIPGFRDELRSQCAGDAYITQEERSAMSALAPASKEYRAMLAASNERIDKDFQICSYNLFLAAQTGPVRGRMHADLLVVDEVQNINSPNGATYRAITGWIDDHPDASIVIMSGTPLFDTPNELVGLARLLRIPAEKATLAAIPTSFTGKVSYFAGAPKFTFPTATIKVKRCLMSAFQRRWYSSEVAAEIKKHKLTLHPVSNDFYIKSRQRSNVVYPKGLTGQAGLDELTSALIRESLSTYSTKMVHVLKQLNKGKLSFLFDNFTEYGGIKFITKCLCAYGYSDYFTAGPGPKRYAVWSGDQTSAQKAIIKTVFNRADNDSAGQLQLVIGSSSIKEGVTLLRVRKVMIMEGLWNHSSLEQIYGRAVRYCSHKSLPSEDRTVDIYIYAAVTNNSRTIPTPEISIDLHMLNLADKKRAECEQYLQALINCAVDKYLWYGS